MTYIDNEEKALEIENKAAMIWSIADKLTGAYKPHEYGLVILPLTVLRRLDCALEPTRDAVMAKYEAVKDLPEEYRETLLSEVSGLQYYSLNKRGLRSVIDKPKDVSGALKRFIANFSQNVQDILTEFNLDEQIDRMEGASSNGHGLLYAVIDEITQDKNDLSPSKVSDIDMGYIFEEIIRKFSESYNEDAGQHYTPRDAVDLMVEILIRQKDRDTRVETVRSMLDSACGTGGMLSESLDYINRINPKVHLQCHGQEYNAETYAICRANMLMKNQISENINDIRKGNTLSDYQFKGQKFNYVIMNPPFGREWKVEKNEVQDEAGDPQGRFSYGLPPIDDSQMLFLSSAISSLESPEEGNMIGGRITIVHNGSPLSGGDAGSGPSEIRRHILQNDLLDAIIALPKNLFYNTSIGTYIWVLDNNKEEKRKGKVQLIDATNMYNIRKKSVGKKRFDIDREYIDMIVRAYREFSDAKYGQGDKICESKVIDVYDFGFLKASIIVPQLDEEGNPAKNKRGSIIYDKAKTDFEIIPLKGISTSSDNDILRNPEIKRIIEDYMEKEVRPFLKYAEVDMKNIKVGFKIPFNSYFFKPNMPRSSDEILSDITQLNQEISSIMKELI